MHSLRSTTALVVALSLIFPAPVVAQGKGHAKQLARDLGLEICGDEVPVPCLTEDATLLIDTPAEGLPVCGEGVPPCIAESGFVEVDPGSDLALQAIGNLASAEAQPEVLPESVPAAETPASPETAVAAQPEAAPEETPVSDGAAVAEVPAEATATEPEPIQAAPEQAASDAALAAEAVPERAPGAEPASETAPEKAVSPGEDRPPDAVAEADLPQAETAETVVVEEEAPTAAAAAAEGDASATTEAVIETEQVTDETARSASEDFATSAKGASAEATAAATKDNKGLSNFEKALLLGLGTLAVGAVLNNGDKIVSNSGDRVVLKDDAGNLRVLKDDDVLLRRPGSEVRTETFRDGSTRTIVAREDGTKIVTIRGADGRVVYRERVFQDGSRVVLFDDTEASQPVTVSQLPRAEARPIIVDTADEDALRRALADVEAQRIGRTFSLRQIRQIREVRELAPEIELAGITFDTGSAAIRPSQAEELAALGRAMVRIIDERPNEVFLIEGHTDATGDAGLNLALSDRRAETVALALTEYFFVPPENMITQGYGESELKIQTQEAERQNRRAVVRRITPLLRQASRN